MAVEARSDDRRVPVNSDPTGKGLCLASLLVSRAIASGAVHRLCRLPAPVAFLGSTGARDVPLSESRRIHLEDLARTMNVNEVDPDPLRFLRRRCLLPVKIAEIEVQRVSTCEVLEVVVHATHCRRQKHLEIPIRVFAKDLCPFLRSTLDFREADDRLVFGARVGSCHRSNQDDQVSWWGVSVEVNRHTADDRLRPRGTALDTKKRHHDENYEFLHNSPPIKFLGTTHEDISKNTNKNQYENRNSFEFLFLKIL